jgi:hypothetical protein
MQTRLELLGSDHWKIGVDGATILSVSSTTRVMLRGLMGGVLAAAIPSMVSDWSKPRVAILMGCLGTVALVVILAEQITGGARSEP